MSCKKPPIPFDLITIYDQPLICDSCFDKYSTIKINSKSYCWICFCKKYFICHENKHILKPHCHAIFKIK